MRPVPARCPICAHPEITVTRFECPHCASTVDGRFGLTRFNRLTTDQLHFAEIFLLNEGKINRVEQEMGLSYAAVRGRLEEVIQALGGQLSAATPGADQPAEADTPATAEKRREILARVSAGDLSAAEAATLLQELP